MGKPEKESRIGVVGEMLIALESRIQRREGSSGSQEVIVSIALKKQAMIM